jgi:hypothetical protein
MSVAVKNRSTILVLPLRGNTAYERLRFHEMGARIKVIPENLTSRDFPISKVFVKYYLNISRLFRSLSMPRRPRPADRPAPKSKLIAAPRTAHKEPSIAPPEGQYITFSKPEPQSKDEESGGEQMLADDHGRPGMSGKDSDYALSGSEPDREQDYEDVDVDAPRVAQWEPDDSGLVEHESEVGEENASNNAGPTHVQLVWFSIANVNLVCILCVSPRNLFRMVRSFCASQNVC